MKLMPCCLAVLLVYCNAPPAWSRPVVGRPGPVDPPGIRNVAEFTFALRAQYDNPHDPDQISVDAAVTGPYGTQWTVPAFWYEPCTRTVQQPELGLEAVKLLRFFVGARNFAPNTTVRFVVDCIEVLNSESGASRIIDDFEGLIRWKPGAGVTLKRYTKEPPSGKAALLVQIITGEGSRWPGLTLPLGPDDWSGFDSLRLQYRAISGLGGRNASVGLEFYNTAGRKFQTSIGEPASVLRTRGWRQVVWAFGGRASIPTSVWTTQGEGSWRLRIAVPRSGMYRVRVRARDASGESEGRAGRFRLTQHEPDGFLRADDEAKRYMRFDSGKSYFAVGTNLIGRDAATYDYFLPKFADAGCNFVRFWMSGRSLGIELDELTKYDQRRAAAMDHLVSLSRDRGVYLMFCLTDFRETGDRHRNNYWKDVGYSKICASPLGFFKDGAAMHAYKKRLRYVVARWTASAAVHSWEFFNEVNITNSWRQEPDKVRTWHQEMARYLRGVDPYDHVITTSFAGLEDDALWEQPLMGITQRHYYTEDMVSFADMLSEATYLLRRHSKPTLVGEFGRRRNRYANLDSEGVSLHNGIWATTMSGSSGTAMPWWWFWIDTYDLYRHYAPLTRFVKDVQWTREEYAPIRSEHIKIRVSSDLAGLPHQTVRLTTFPGSFKEAPFNRPQTVTVRPDGTLHPDVRISNLRHGVRNHRGLHNPVTFSVDFPVQGALNVYVAGVSGYGGAGLTIRVDDETVLEKDFEDTSPNGHAMIMEYNGCYAVDVPPGIHTVVVENSGNDWFRMPLVTLSNYGMATPKVSVLGLRGTQSMLLWARNRAYVWYRPLIDGKLVPARDVKVTISKVPAGSYRARLFDPQNGVWLDTKELQTDGDLLVPLGTVQKDIAVRLDRRSLRAAGAQSVSAARRPLRRNRPHASPVRMAQKEGEEESERARHLLRGGEDRLPGPVVRSFWRRRPNAASVVPSWCPRQVGTTRCPDAPARISTSCAPGRTRTSVCSSVRPGTCTLRPARSRGGFDTGARATRPCASEFTR